VTVYGLVPVFFAAHVLPSFVDPHNLDPKGPAHREQYHIEVSSGSSLSAQFQEPVVIFSTSTASAVASTAALPPDWFK